MKYEALRVENARESDHFFKKEQIFLTLLRIKYGNVQFTTEWKVYRPDFQSCFIDKLKGSVSFDIDLVLWLFAPKELMETSIYSIPASLMLAKDASLMPPIMLTDVPILLFCAHEARQIRREATAVRIRFMMRWFSLVLLILYRCGTGLF